MPIRAVIFDKDGTLIDFNRTWGPAAYFVMAEIAGGDEGHIDRLARLSKYDLGERTFARDSIVFADATSVYGPMWAACLGLAPSDAFNARIDRLFHHHSLDHVAPFADTHETVAALAGAGLILGCVTNDSEACARDQLDRLGLSAHFAGGVIGYDSGHGRKPDCGQLLAFAERVSIPPSEIAMVGDSLHDLHASRAAGCLTIAVTTGGHDVDELAGHADAVLACLAELPLALAERHRAAS